MFGKKITTVAISLILILMMSVGCIAESAESQFLASVDWAAEYDVIVIGYGMAGASASIRAAENGAKVLMIEKAPKGQEGGNSRYAGQCVYSIDPSRREDGLAYLKAMRGEYDTPSDAVLETMVDGYIANGLWIEERVPEDVNALSGQRLRLLSALERRVLHG